LRAATLPTRNLVTDADFLPTPTLLRFETVFSALRTDALLKALFTFREPETLRRLALRRATERTDARLADARFLFAVFFFATFFFAVFFFAAFFFFGLATI
jgi:hypothetical protein